MRRNFPMFLMCLLFGVNALAGVEYDSKNNVVTISTPLLARNIDTGFIQIHNDNHIRIVGSAIDKSNDKLIGMCGNEPSLGLLLLNGRLSVESKVPKVTDVEKWPSENKSVKTDEWVRAYLLRGEDAQDLMDLLYEYDSVGFAMTGNKCAESEHFTPGKIIINFETRGLERAMRRLK